MFILMIIIFVLGYTAIALEHPLRIDKAASALLIGVLTWVVYILGADVILGTNHVGWTEFATVNPGKNFVDFIAHHEILHHLGEISEILFFLLGAMTIVEIVDQHEGFKIITDKVRTTNKVRLVWIVSFLTFFMSAALDNLTTTIVMVALIRKLIADKHDRWMFASLVVLAANAGGAWSPIGDVTTIMLWIGGQVSAANIIVKVIFPSLVTMIVPLIIVTFTMKGNVKRPEIKITDHHGVQTSSKERNFIFGLGVLSLLFVPVFKTVTHLPPYMGMLLGLGNMWVVTEIMHRNKRREEKSKLSVVGILTKVDVPTVLFFLGILSAVAALQSAGHLRILASFLDNTFHNIYAINLTIGVLSSIVDNVPLVAGAMGMYDIVTPETLQSLPDPVYAKAFMTDGNFWEFLAYCAGTGGSVLIIGSAAGVAAMGMERIDFIWYMKRISLLALLGYFAGAGAFYLQQMFLH